MPVLFGVAALGLGLGAVVGAREGGTGLGTIVLILAGGVALTVGRPSLGDTADLSRCATGVPRRRLMTAAALGIAAVACSVVDYLVELDSQRGDRDGLWGLALWGMSIALAIGAAWLVGRRGAVADWPTDPQPSGRIRLLAAAGIAVALVAGAVLRLVDLGRVPRGINPDEGDRAAAAISLLAGTVGRDPFVDGWYYIFNVYFWPLAGVMHVLGTGVAEARVLGALCGIATLAVVTWIGVRHFGALVGVATAVIGSGLAVSLHFARLTTEATPTALCWTVSVALLLEAVRGGALWRWAAFGSTGALSLYLYPSGRLWVAFAALVVVYLLVRARPGGRQAVLIGGAVSAIAAAITLAPLLAFLRVHPDLFTLRAEQTSIFSGDNASRLPYHQPGWSTAELLWAQVRHSVDAFVHRGDGGSFWATGRPIVDPLTAALTLVGLVWLALRGRHVPSVVVCLWFVAGTVGMVVTVETPNVQRMATAMPAIPLVAAVVLVEIARRSLEALRAAGGAHRRTLGGACAALVLVTAAGVAAANARWYLGTYASEDPWPAYRVEAMAVAEEGSGSRVLSIGSQFHRISSGWVRLGAPGADRDGLRDVGNGLPLRDPGDEGLSLLVYPDQSAYLPLLRAAYPGGSTHTYALPSEPVVVAYRITARAAAAALGALALGGDAPPRRVDTLGALPPGAAGPVGMRWIAVLRVPGYGPRRFRVTGGAGLLSLDGVAVRAGSTLTLAKGRHLVELEARGGRSAAPRVEWASGVGPPDWRPLGRADLLATSRVHGLIGTVTRQGRPPIRRIDAALAMCCLAEAVGGGAPSVTGVWRGLLRAPRSGRYLLEIVSTGRASIRVDGVERLGADGTGVVELSAGEHAVVIRAELALPGRLELLWTPPDGLRGVVPPLALRPGPIGAEPPLSTDALHALPADDPDGSLTVRR